MAQKRVSHEAILLRPALTTLSFSRDPLCLLLLAVGQRALSTHLGLRRPRPHNQAVGRAQGLRRSWLLLSGCAPGTVPPPPLSAAEGCLRLDCSTMRWGHSGQPPRCWPPAGHGKTLGYSRSLHCIQTRQRNALPKAQPALQHSRTAAQSAANQVSLPQACKYVCLARAQLGNQVCTG